MDKELIRIKLYEFLEYRKNYLKEKKVLILEILTNKSNERVSELKSLKEKYFQEFMVVEGVGLLPRSILWPILVK